MMCFEDLPPMPVQIVTMMGITTYSWKDAGISLKTEGNVMGMKIDEEAFSSEVNLPGRAGFFDGREQDG